MRDSRWPDPVQESGQLPPWLGLATFVALAGALVGLVFTGGAPTLRLPEISMPRFELPQMAVREPDDRSRAEAPRAEIPGQEFAARADSETFPEAGTTVRSVAFADCVGMMDSMASGFITPVIVEDTPGRRVLRYKFEDGDVTLTCSGADNTMTIETRP